MPIPESNEVYRERLADLFTAWIEFYKKRYATVFTDEYRKEWESVIIGFIKEGSDEEVLSAIQYMLKMSIQRVLESLEATVRQSITGVQMPPEEL